MRQRHVSLVVGIAIAIIFGGCSGTDQTKSSPLLTQTVRPSGDAPAATGVIADPGAPAASSPIGSADPSLDELPTRIVIAGLHVDLPIVSGDLSAAGNPPDYPLCDVAQYLTTYRYPGRPGTTTWIYGHARIGMLLPLLEASETHGGKALIGSLVRVYTDGAQRYTYRITKVLRHATDRTSAARVPPDSRRLIVQTSEGPKGTVPKLQVVAELVDIAASTRAASEPKAHPRGCSGD